LKSENIKILMILLAAILKITAPTKFSETDDLIFTKLHRKVDPHLKRCIQVLEFSKWPPLPYKLASEKKRRKNGNSNKKRCKNKMSPKLRLGT
jgi:hypothetical protein